MENKLSDRPWKIDREGLTLKMRLTAKAGSDRIDGIRQLADQQWVVVARVRAVPEKGQANTALLHLLAQSMELPFSALTLSKGQTQRQKTIKLAACDTQKALKFLVSL